ncbi:MAG: hypothetical protein AABX11_05575 [Nanoarchaeota archaeon]
MNTLTQLAIKNMAGKYSKPIAELVKEGEGVSRLEHYIFVRGVMGVSGKKDLWNLLQGI